MTNINEEILDREREKWIVDNFGEDNGLETYSKLIDLVHSGNIPADMPQSLVEDINSLIDLGESLSLIAPAFYKLQSDLKVVCTNVKSCFNKLSHAMSQFTTGVSEIIESFDYIELKKELTENVIKKNEALIDEFLDQNIFPPIFYSNSKLLLKSTPSDLQEKKLKDHYLKSMRSKWIKEEYPDYIKLMINEIADGYDEGKIYTTTFGLFTLLEYRLSLTPTINDTKKLTYPEKSGIIQNEIINRSVATDKFLSFITKVIFKNTRQNDIETVSRHVVHGHRLDLVRYEGMMSWIFLYDFVDNLLKLDINRLKQIK